MLSMRIDGNHFYYENEIEKVIPSIFCTNVSQATYMPHSRIRMFLYISTSTISNVNIVTFYVHAAK